MTNDYENSNEETKQMVKGLYGSEFDKNRACAFCRHHHKYLTVKQVRQHDCLGKQCWYLHKNENHDWWRQREVIKQRRREKRQQLITNDNYKV
ncbi:MAG: hypothetical protein IJW86_03665 [Clostridia bacterium]|nr:hypothetical protein [Clostridia bacterium]